MDMQTNISYPFNHQSRLSKVHRLIVKKINGKEYWFVEIQGDS